jgi:hypothetical protein
MVEAAVRTLLVVATPMVVVVVGRQLMDQLR